MSRPVPTLAIVIPARDEAINISRCIEAVQASVLRSGVNAEIVVVDDDSSDETAEIASRAGVRVITHPHRCGPRLAWETGVSHTTASWILLTDADCTVAPDAIRVMLAATADAKVGILGGRSVPVTDSGGMVARSARFSARLLHEIKRRLDDHEFIPIGRLMLVRRDAWTVHESLRGPCDLALAHQVRSSGSKVRYVPSAIVRYQAVTNYPELAADYRRTALAQRRLDSKPNQVPRPTLVKAFPAALAQAPWDGISWLFLRGSLIMLHRIRRPLDLDELLVRWQPSRSIVKKRGGLE